MSLSQIQPLFKKYGASYGAAALDLSAHTVYLICSYYLVWYFRNSVLSLVTIALLGLLNVKSFIIFHDCGHNSYTPSETINQVLGTILGPMVFTPYSWSYVHKTHHLTNGRKGNAYDFPHTELVFNTFKSYQQMSVLKRRVVKCLFSPYTLLIFLANLVFIVKQRLYVLSFFMDKYANIPSFTYLIAEQILNNLGIACMMYMWYQYGILFHCILSICIAGTIGTTLFFNQHTFNPPYITSNDDWTMRESGLKGSSFIQIPWFLKYFMGGIEYHHIHHYNSKIPNYNLRELHDKVTSTSNAFDGIVSLSMSDCYKNLWLSVYDEDANRFITFEEADARISSD
jgi:acyl-lipid omega-6 desaturase (Delta-12 desaturase)